MATAMRSSTRQMMLDEDVAQPRQQQPRRRRARRRRARRPMAMPSIDGFGGGGGGRFMRKVWFREGDVARTSEVLERDRVSLRRAEERFAENPNSRDRHRALVRALSRAGELERAEAVAKQWLERDQLDPEALIYLLSLIHI